MSTVLTEKTAARYSEEQPCMMFVLDKHLRGPLSLVETIAVKFFVTLLEHFRMILDDKLMRVGIYRRWSHSGPGGVFDSLQYMLDTYSLQ